MQIVRHDFSSGSSSEAGSITSSSRGGSEAGSGSSASGRSGTSSSSSSGGGGGSGRSGAERTSKYSNSNKTGLTPADAARIAEALKSAARRHKGDTIHTLFTSNGSPYQNIQGRIM
jgi:hypothetical protein